MTIEKGKVVTLTYELKEKNQSGELLQKVERKEPMAFLFGQGILIPKFENNILGLSKGDIFSFDIPHQEAYGAFDQNAILELSKDVFAIDGEIDHEMLVAGNSIPMEDDNGNHFSAYVVEVKDQVVVMDFNHPLAGVDLYFSGEIIDVRDATSEETAHGHVHHDHDHPHGHHH